MPRETLGYVRMVWICPNCQNKNPGNFRFCRGCGASQPADVRFVQETGQGLVQDANEIEQAAQGPDVHCGYCGARNPATAKECQSCGADMATGTKRESGTVVGVFQPGAAAEVPCPNCGTLNLDTDLTCKGCGAALTAKPVQPPAAQAPASPAHKINPWVIAGILVVLLAACIAATMMLTRTSGTTGTVDRLQWERSIAILALQPVERQDWKNEIPSGAEVGTCEQRIYGESEQPEANAEKVCGTPYSVDKGNGYAEVVQDCKYEIYRDYCSYTVQDWAVVDTAVERGFDNVPAWPQVNLAEGQRQGNQRETFAIVFSTGDGEKTYQTSDESLFAAARPGTKWTLQVNSFGSIVSIEPEN